MDKINELERRELICNLVRTMRDEGSWSGETQIQKSVMFLQELFDVPIGYDFVLYLHGPFSFELRGHLAQMRILLYLDVEPRANYGPSFTLGQRGEQVKSILPKYQSAIDFVAQQVSGTMFAPLRGYPRPSSYRTTTLHYEMPARWLPRCIDSNRTSVSNRLSGRLNKLMRSSGRQQD